MNTRSELTKDIVSIDREDEPLIWISERAINLKKENDDLHHRIDKAIEYIEKNKAKLPQRRDDFTCEIVYSDEVVLANGLLRILKGRENSE